MKNTRRRRVIKETRFYMVRGTESYLSLDISYCGQVKAEVRNSGRKWKSRWVDDSKALMDKAVHKGLIFHLEQCLEPLEA